MRWTYTWVLGHDGRGPRWWEVVLWVFLLGVANVGIVLAVPWDTGALVFLIAVSVLGWAWGRSGTLAIRADEAAGSAVGGGRGLVA